MLSLQNTRQRMVGVSVGNNVGGMMIRNATDGFCAASGIHLPVNSIVHGWPGQVKIG